MRQTLLQLGHLTGFALGALTCSTSFNQVSSWDFTEALNPGWNTGNTLDAIPSETSWGQPMLANETFTNARQRGFKGVRIPVTWADHFISGAPDYTVDPAWLQRVSDVVDYALSNGLLAIVNAHHDSWSWLNPDSAGFNRDEALTKFYRLWFQIGVKLGCKSSSLAFETINEPAGDTSKPANGDFLNQLHANMVSAIRNAGGHNANRVVLLCGLSDGYTTAMDYLKLPPNMTNPWALTWHMYGPWSFTAAAFGDTTWGSLDQKRDMYDNIHWARTNFTNVPIIIGEFGIDTSQTEAAARWRYYDFVVGAAYNSTTSVMLWDASGSFAPNTAHPYGDPTALDIIISAARGVQNALPDSTTDANADGYWSSAQLFHKVGDPISDWTALPFLWNNKTLQKMLCQGGSCPRSTLTAKADYRISGANLEFSKSFMTAMFPGAGEAPGLRGTLVLQFDQGAADLIIPAYLWSKPTLAKTSMTVTKEMAMSDLWIPIKYAGMPQVAMVLAQMTNGTYLVDSWTQWSGPMKRGAAKYGSDWSYNATHLHLTSSTLQLILDAKVATNFTIQCYPRTGKGDNDAFLTLTPGTS